MHCFDHQQDEGSFNRLCAPMSITLNAPGELLQLLFAVPIAEYHLMSGTREDRSKLAAHHPEPKMPTRILLPNPVTFCRTSTNFLR